MADDVNRESMDPADLVRSYYDAIDGDDYERLSELLAPSFTQQRGDRTFEDREAFIRFMREERPERDTTHDLHHLTADEERVVVEGTLRRANGEVWFRFADAFDVEGDRLSGLRTYSLSQRA